MNDSTVTFDMGDGRLLVVKCWPGEDPYLRWEASVKDDSGRYGLPLQIVRVERGT